MTLFFPIFLFVFFSCSSEKEETIPSGFDTFYDLHGNDKNITTIGIPKFIFKMFIDIPNKEIEDAVDNIKTIDLMVISDPAEHLIGELFAQFPIKYYKPVLSVNDENAKIKFFAKEKKEKVDEIIMVAQQQTENNCAVLRLGGSFNLKTVENLAEKLDVRQIINYR
jgi:hypothetical protein